MWPVDLFSSARVNKCWATGNNSAAAESPSHCVMWVSGARLLCTVAFGRSYSDSHTCKQTRVRMQLHTQTQTFSPQRAAPLMQCNTLSHTDFPSSRHPGFCVLSYSDENVPKTLYAKHAAGESQLIGKRQMKKSWKKSSHWMRVHWWASKRKVRSCPRFVDVGK